MEDSKFNFGYFEFNSPNAVRWIALELRRKIQTSVRDLEIIHSLQERRTLSQTHKKPPSLKNRQQKTRTERQLKNRRTNQGTCFKNKGWVRWI